MIHVGSDARSSWKKQRFLWSCRLCSLGMSVPAPLESNFFTVCQVFLQPYALQVCNPAMSGPVTSPLYLCLCHVSLSPYATFCMPTLSGSSLSRMPIELTVYFHSRVYSLKLKVLRLSHYFSLLSSLTCFPLSSLFFSSSSFFLISLSSVFFSLLHSPPFFYLSLSYL
jgi:hypothetical protein